MNTDKIVRLCDVLTALGDEPIVMDNSDMIQMQNHVDWECTKAEIDKIKPLPFCVHELTDKDLTTLHGDPVIVSAPGTDVDRKIMTCLGCHKDVDGQTYIVLNGAEYALELFKIGAMKLYSVT